MASKNKVFGIGLYKTGTTSLGHALKRLGFNHKFWDEKLKQKYDEGDYEFIFREAENYDSFEDVPWCRDEFYKEIDKRFPGSKFILTKREMKSWIKSWEEHNSAKRLRKRPYELWKRGYSEKKKLEVIARHEKHIEGILKYFQERPEDLLVIDICGGEGWEKLCPFLGLPVQTEPFPHTNITAKRGDHSTLGVWQRIIKRAVYKQKESIKHVVRQLAK